VTFVSSLALAGGNHGDIWVHGATAYIGTTYRPNCPASGVKIVDLSNPASPALLGAVAARPGTATDEGATIAVATPAFRGDLLAVVVEPCEKGGSGGVELWDVTDPRHPQQLSVYEAVGAHFGVDSLALVQRPADGRVLLLISVPSAELDGVGGEYRFLDVTDPRAPVLISEWSIGERLGINPRGGQGQYKDIVGNAAAFNDAGTLAVLSYLDAGYVLLDVADPANPTLLSRTSYTPDEEGNAGPVAFAQSDQLLLAVDEDFNVRVPGLRIVAPDTVAGTAEIVEADPAFSAQLSAVGPLTGQAVYLGRGCPDPGDVAGQVPAGGDPYQADPRGAIAVIDRGACDFSGKVARAQEAGAIAVVLVNSEPGSPIRPLSQISVSIPVVHVEQTGGERIKSALAAGAPVTLTLAADIVHGYNTWGYLRLFDISTPTHPVQVGRFATEHTTPDPVAGPVDSGQYLASDPLVEGTLAYVPWFSDGLRIVDVADPANPRELGFFVPPDTPALSPDTTAKADVWGVAKLGDYLVLSDMDYGLYVVRYSPEAQEDAPARTGPRPDAAPPVQTPAVQVP
jgi:hypothetical protein